MYLKRLASLNPIDVANLRTSHPGTNITVSALDTLDVEISVSARPKFTATKHRQEFVR